MRKLIAKRKGLTQAQAAVAIGITPRLMRRYLRHTGGDALVAPYPVYFALLALTARSFKLKPNAKAHNPDPKYLRRLIERSGLSQVRAAKTIGISPQTMRRYLRRDRDCGIPYSAQYALERLAHSAGGHADRQL